MIIQGIVTQIIPLDKVRDYLINNKKSIIDDKKNVVVIYKEYYVKMSFLRRIIHSICRVMFGYGREKNLYWVVLFNHIDFVEGDKIIVNCKPYFAKTAFFAANNNGYNVVRKRK